jgi:hypothetical protein
MTITWIGLKFNFSIWAITPIPLKSIPKIKIYPSSKPMPNLSPKLTSRNLIKLMSLEKEALEKYSFFYS